MNSLLQLIEHGQSYWIDNLERRMLMDGELRHRVDYEGLRGLTSNPATFQKAIAAGGDYDAQIGQFLDKQPGADSGVLREELAEALMVADIQAACDILRPVYQRSGGLDGYASLEVSPRLAYHTEATLDAARRLHRAVNRPNLFIKIPGTLPGLRAIEELLYEGININITLLFSVERYEAVVAAYLQALERRRDAGALLAPVASVASFFLSRIDVLVDRLLAQRIALAGVAELPPNPARLLGRAAVANAKLAYQSFKRTVAGERWRALAGQGAKVQRLLWASTGVKNSQYDDVMYIEPLIGPDTVNTMPESAIQAFANHGRVADTLEDGVDEARQVMDGLAALGIDFHQVTAQLESEGVEKFIGPYESLLNTLGERIKAYRSRAKAGLEPVSG